MHTTPLLLAALSLLTPTLAAPISHDIEIIITTDSSLPIRHALKAAPHVSKHEGDANTEQCLELHFLHSVNCVAEVTKGWYFAHGQCCHDPDKDDFVSAKHEMITAVNGEMPTGFNINTKVKNDMPSGFDMNAHKGSQSVVQVHMPNGFDASVDELKSANEGGMPTGFGSEHHVKGEMPTGFGKSQSKGQDGMPTGFESKGRIKSHIEVIHTEMQ